MQWSAAMPRWSGNHLSALPIAVLRDFGRVFRPVDVERVAERVLRSAEVPLLLVRTPAAMPRAESSALAKAGLHG